MEADAAYQGCLLSCELHSRSLAVRRTGASDLEIAHTWFTQSRDCADVLHNLLIPRMPNAISRLRKFLDCTEQIYCGLAKRCPWAEHLTKLQKRGVGALSSVSAFNHKRALMSCLQRLDAPN